MSIVVVSALALGLACTSLGPVRHACNVATITPNPTPLVVAGHFNLSAAFANPGTCIPRERSALSWSSSDCEDAYCQSWPDIGPIGIWTFNTQGGDAPHTIGVTPQRDQFFSSAGTRIRYIEQGSGEPVVLIHGFANRADIWMNTGIMPDLARDHRVIAFDLRGHGKSDKPHDPAAYGREMTLDIVRLLDHLGIQRAHIVGYSLGATLTVQLLTLYPERFLSATLIAGAGRYDWDSVKARQADTVANELEQHCISRSLLRRILRPDVPSDDSLAILETHCFADSTQDRRALAAMTRSWSGQAITPAAIAGVTVPTLALVGSDDPAAQPLERLVRIRPSVKLVAIDGATHAGARSILRRPETIEYLRGFLAEHAVAPAPSPGHNNE